MKAVTWHGKRDVRVDTVPDPMIQEPTDAIIEVTSTNICGSDLHLYEMLGPFMSEGDILGHEPMGIVEEVGSEVTEPRRRRPGRHPVPDLLRPLLHVRRSSSTPSARRPRSATRAWAPRCSATPSSTAQVPGRPGRVPAGAAGPVHPHQGARRSAGRAVRLPLRRAADRVAGGRVRRRSRRAAASSCSVSARSATWPPGSPSTRAPAGDRRRPRARAARARPAARRRGARPRRASTTTSATRSAT